MGNADTFADKKNTNATILIVDDQEENVLLLEMMLGKAGYTDVTGITDPRLVLELHQEHRYDLILLDLRMPHLDGFQVMEQLSGAIRDDYLPVLVLTAEQEETSRFQAFELGAKDFITKPFNKIEILNRIRNMLEVRISHNQVRDQNLQLEQRVAERTQKLAEALKEAESANYAKTIFLANMSHELRTPLNGIIGFAEIMKAQMFGDMGTRQYLEYSQDIYDAGRHLLGIISKILDISSIESGDMEFQKAKFNLSDAIEECMRMVREEAKASGISLAIEIDPQITSIVADRIYFKQIVLNLLSNSIKSAPNGSIKISAEQEDLGLVIRVSDTGRGIPEAYHDRVLEPFRQVRERFGMTSEGMGLGLYLVKTFAEMHGGTLDLQSEVGKGTTVNVRFPPSIFDEDSINDSATDQ